MLMDRAGRITEQASEHRHLERRSTRELLELMNAEDRTVADAVARAIPSIEKLVEGVLDHMLAGGRLFYLGAGTSGRLGIVDASECPPTFGISHGLVIGLIAGGDSAIRKAVEFAEDREDGGWLDLQEYQVNPSDFVIGIAASGTTPYVVGAVKRCREAGILTGCITNNPNSPLAQSVDFPVEVITGPELLTGSTRMKAGTAQKLVLNMISTSLMIRLGRVEDNRMVDMQLSNEKLLDRGARMIMAGSDLSYEQARTSLLRHGSVRKAMAANQMP